MKTQMTILTLISVAMLSACGGGGGGGGGGGNGGSGGTAAAPSPAQTPTPTPVSTPTKKGVFPILVMVRGDSTNYGSFPGKTCNGAPNQTCANPPALMQTDFDIEFGPGVVKVINRAEPGSDLSNDLNGTYPYTMAPLASELATSDSDIVITNSEINDQDRFTPEAYKGNLTQWVKTVQQSGKIAILEEPNPTCGVGVKDAFADPGVYVQRMRDVGVEQGVTVLPLYNNFVVQPNWTALLQGDCVHPLDSGYEYKEGQYMKTLMPIITKMVADRKN